MAEDYSIVMRTSTYAGGFHDFQPIFFVSRGTQLVGRLYVRVEDLAATVVLARLGPTPDAADEREPSVEPLNALVVRYALGRLERELSTPGGAEALFAGGDPVWLVGSDNFEATLLNPSLHGKSCTYRRSSGRDLYCATPAADDPANIGEFDGWPVAPTTAPVCASCQVPDERVLCSSFTHPEVIAVQSWGEPLERRVSSALCGAGRDEIANGFEQCRINGHQCASRLVPIPAPRATEAASPMSFPEALDFLDAVWMLAEGVHLVRPATFTDAAGLVQDCETRDELEGRLSDIADALDRISVDKKLIPAAAGKVEGSLNQLKAVLLATDGVDEGAVEESVQALQRIRALRHCGQHSGKAAQWPELLQKLGVPDEGLTNGETLERIKRIAVSALRTLRTEVRRHRVSADKPGAGSA